MEEPHTGTHSMGNAQFCPEIGLYLSLLDINTPPHTHTHKPWFGIFHIVYLVY